MLNRKPGRKQVLYEIELNQFCQEMASLFEDDPIELRARVVKVLV